MPNSQAERDGVPNTKVAENVLFAAIASAAVEPLLYLKEIIDTSILLQAESTSIGIGVVAAASWVWLDRRASRTGTRQQG